MSHFLLDRQLRKLGLDPASPPDREQWRALLAELEQVYTGKHVERRPSSLLRRSVAEPIGPSIADQGVVRATATATEGNAAEADGDEAYRRLVDSAPAVIFTLSVADGSFLSLNPAFEELTGWPPEQWVGKPFTSISHPDDVGLAVASIHQLLVGESRCTFRMRVRTADDADRVAEFTIKPLDGDPGVREILGVARDNTAHDRVERDLRAAKEAAENASRGKSEFLANVSHEIRTPMNGIVGMTGMLLESPLDERQIDYVETIRASGDTLLTLINDLLDYSKIESGKLELEEQPLLLQECVQSCIDLATPKAAEKGLDIGLTVVGDCPELVVGDETRLRQILSNLLTNSVKFTSDGEVEVVLSARRLARDRYVIKMSVRDTGVGIADDRIDRIFESFTQADASTTRKFGGTGLGLSICKHLCQLMGGRIWVESEVGNGSTFHVTVLAGVVDEDEITGARGLAKPSAWPDVDRHLARNLPLRILVADDSVVNQKVALLFLERMGYRADVVANGVEVLEAFERQHYDVVLMDVQMPELDGMQTTKRLRAGLAADRQPKIIAITAGVMHGDRDKCMAVGMDEFLGKPVQIEALQQALLTVGESIDQSPAAPEIVLEEAPPTAAVASPSGAAGSASRSDADSQRAGINLEVLADLYRLRPQVMTDLVDKFLDSAERRVELLVEAINDRDVEPLMSAAHSLKGSCGTLGAMAMARICSDLMTNADSLIDSDVGSQQAIRQLRDEHRRVAETFRRQLASWQQQDRVAMAAAGGET